MDGLKNIDVNQSQSLDSNKPIRKKVNSKTILLIVLLLLFRVAMRSGAISTLIDKFITHDRENAQQVVENAIMAMNTIAEGQTVEQYRNQICLYTTKEVCDLVYEKFTSAYFNEIDQPVSCSIQNIEYLNKIKDSNNRVLILFKIQYTISHPGSDTDEHFDDVTFAIKDGEWKLFNLLSSEEYEELITKAKK